MAVDWLAGKRVKGTSSERTTGTWTLQDGTIFEETDTNKAYIWNASTSTWTQL